MVRVEIVINHSLLAHYTPPAKPGHLLLVTANNKSPAQLAFQLFKNIASKDSETPRPPTSNNGTACKPTPTSTSL
jgi:hypothetical protein